MQHIQNGHPQTEEVLRYQYRRLFGLTAGQYEAEPIDQRNENLFIYSQILKQKDREAKHGSS